MDYRIIVLDIDGTLTNSQKEISAPTREGLIEIQERGYKVVLASGRPQQGVEGLADELKLDKYGSYILCFNGGRIINCKTKEIVYEKTYSKSNLPIIYKVAMEFGTGLMTYRGDDIILATAPDQYIELESRINGMPMVRPDNFFEFVDFDLNKCILTGEPEVLVKAEKRLNSIFNQYLNVYRSEPFFLEVMPQKIDKAHSLLKLLGSLGLNSDQMVCCGDGFNDITMLECAGLGVAMENAQDLVKEAADYITGSNDENGIVQVIEKFFK